MMNRALHRKIAILVTTLLTIALASVANDAINAMRHH